MCQIAGGGGVLRQKQKRNRLILLYCVDCHKMTKFLVQKTT